MHVLYVFVVMNGQCVPNIVCALSYMCVLWLVHVCANRDALLQKQIKIEEEFERKIQAVMHQLQLEVENKETLEQELKGLRARQRQASLRILSSTPAREKKQLVPFSQPSPDLVSSEPSSQTGQVAVSDARSPDPEQSLMVSTLDTRSPEPGQPLAMTGTRSPHTKQSIVHPEDLPNSFFEPAFASQKESNPVPLEPFSASPGLPSSSSPEPESSPTSMKSDTEESDIDAGVPEQQLESSPIQSLRSISAPPLSPPIQQCCVKVTDDGNVMFEADKKRGTVMENHNSQSSEEKYLLLETTGDTDTSCEA